jgi:hypothetical protein
VEEAFRALAVEMRAAQDRDAAATEEEEEEAGKG